VVTGLVGPSTVAHLEEDVQASDLDVPDSILSELNEFVVSDEKRLGEELSREIGSLLGEAITDVSQAPRLVYVLETLAELELAPEEDLIGHFKQLLAVMHGQGDAASLEELRGRLLRYVKR
jgi:hypothetical protein